LKFDRIDIKTKVEAWFRKEPGFFVYRLFETSLSLPKGKIEMLKIKNSER